MTPALKGPRLFLAGVSISENSLEGRTFDVPLAETRHLRDALRLKVGDPVELADPISGTIAQTKIRTLSPLVTLEAVGPIIPPARRSTELHLIFALCKGPKNDLVTDWATELGCASITFWEAERSIVRLKTDQDRETKAARLDKIGWGAAEQSRQLCPPLVTIASSLDEVTRSVASRPASVGLWGSLGSASQELRELQSDVREAASVHLLIGPEGDLSPAEEERLSAAGFRPVTLGDRVLRSELAALTALVSIQGILANR